MYKYIRTYDGRLAHLVYLYNRIWKDANPIQLRNDILNVYPSLLKDELQSLIADITLIINNLER
jgi:hypothetical protein